MIAKIATLANIANIANITTLAKKKYKIEETKKRKII